MARRDDTRREVLLDVCNEPVTSIDALVAALDQEDNLVQSNAAAEGTGLAAARCLVPESARRASLPPPYPASARVPSSAN